MSEIAKCPIPDCHGTCRVIKDYDEGSATAAFEIRCMDCSYSLSRNDHRFGDRDFVIAAHNALCRDVELARNLRKIVVTGDLPLTIQHLAVNGCYEAVTALRLRAQVESADTLDAALDELAAKIEGDDN